MGYTQFKLSQLTGVAQPTIGSAETKGLGSVHVALFAKALEVNAVWLTNGEGPMLAEDILPFKNVKPEDFYGFNDMQMAHLEAQIRLMVHYFKKANAAAVPPPEPWLE